MVAQSVAAAPLVRAFALTLLLAGAATAAACRNVPLLAPSGTAITLVASTNVVALNGSADITAMLLEGSLSGGQNPTVTNGVGTPVHDGTQVSFLTTLGRVEPSEAKTVNGRVTVRLVADGRSGTATITALSGAASQTLDVTVGAAAAIRILVTAEPQALAPSGGTSTIRARVEDQQGNGLQGVPVSFSTSAGSLSATSAVTDGSGVASTTVQTTAAATVTASAGGGTGTLTGTVNVTLRPRTSIIITPPASATESAPASFTLTVSSTAGAASGVLDNVTVQFSDGEKISLGTVTQTTTFGHLFGSSGIHGLSASGVDVEGSTVTASTQVVVTPFTVNGSASPQTTTLGSPILFTASVAPAAVAVDHYVWDFGEGPPITTSSNVQNHVFLSRGTKTVTVTVVPTKGTPRTVTIQCDIS